MFATYLTTLFTLFALLAQSKPLPPPASSLPRAETPGRLYTWQATSFSFGCGPAACGLGFNVTAPAGYYNNGNGNGAPAPAFDVQCGAQYGVQHWTDCRSNTASNSSNSSDSKVQVLWDTGDGAGTAPPYRVRVSHTWFDGVAGARWNATGEGSSDGAADFEVRGTRLLGEVA